MDLTQCIKTKTKCTCLSYLSGTATCTFYKGRQKHGFGETLRHRSALGSGSIISARIPTTDFSLRRFKKHYRLYFLGIGWRCHWEGWSDLKGSQKGSACISIIYIYICCFSHTYIHAWWCLVWRFSSLLLFCRPVQYPRCGNLSFDMDWGAFVTTLLVILERK